MATLGNLGNIAVLHGNYEEALGYFEETLLMVQRSGDRKIESLTLGGYGDVHHQMGLDDVALEYYQQALEIQQ